MTLVRSLEHLRTHQQFNQAATLYFYFMYTKRMHQEFKIFRATSTEALIKMVEISTELTLVEYHFFLKLFI